MVQNHDTISKMKRKRLTDGAVIGLLAGAATGILIVAVYALGMWRPRANFSALFCCTLLGALGGSLGGLLGGLIFPKLGGTKKVLVLGFSAVLCVVCGLIVVIIAMWILAAAFPLTT